MIFNACRTNDLDLDEICSVPLDEPQFLLGRDVHDITYTVLELGDVAFLDHSAHREDRAFDQEVLKRDQVLLTFDQCSDFTDALARDLSAMGLTLLTRCAHRRHCNGA